MKRDSTNPSRPPRTYRAMMRLLFPIERWLHVSCRDFIQLASEKSDRPLSAAEKGRYLFHRMICSICRRQEKRIHQLNDLAKESILQSDRVDQRKLDDEARQHLRERLLKETRD